MGIYTGLIKCGECNHSYKETLIFINGKILLQNKIYSHFETWDSMAQLNSGNSSNFNSRIIINCKEKIKVYYTNISFNKIKNASQSELEKIIEQSNLMAEE